MDKESFYRAALKAAGCPGLKNSIGTLGEKTLHAALKLYFEPDETKHEIRLGAYVADIVNSDGVTEIQTRNFNAMRRKLECFLTRTPVTVVYPVAQTKWLIWLDPATGETTKKRRSPKTGTPFEIFRELCRIKPLLPDPNLRFCIVMLEMNEIRWLNGWSEDKKRGSRRCNRIPCDIFSEIHIRSRSDYGKLIPKGLPEQFTSLDFKKQSGLSLKAAQNALGVLLAVSAVNRLGKKGRYYLYETAGQPEKETGAGRLTEAK